MLLLMTDNDFCLIGGIGMTYTLFMLEISDS